jgi:SAM-dependent methyltransferase
MSCTRGKEYGALALDCVDSRRKPAKIQCMSSPRTSPAPDKPVYENDGYWNARLEKEFSLAGVGHTSVGLAFNRRAYEIRKRVLRRAMREHQIEPKGARIVELAFGTGFYLDLWRELEAEKVFGVDIAEVAVQAARQRYAGWRFERADIGRPLPLDDFKGACRLATAFDVLFHLVEDPAWNGALDNLTQALAPGGWLLISDKFQREQSAVSHVKRRTLRAYEEALAARGFEIASIRPIFFFMNSPSGQTGVSKFFFRSMWSFAKTPYKLGRKVGVGEPGGALSSALLFYPELFLGKISTSGPSTKLLIARKKA